ncbi:hypothetical protein HYU06_06340 [Candidatus Woesearchaeota archaeon]|nr:hypothetical protein [Candidatus Woesearchaeota archaeon]
MGRKCIMCDGEPEFLIKGTNDLYCKGCAEESFADLSYLEKISEQKSSIEDVDELIEQKLSE